METGPEAGEGGREGGPQYDDGPGSKSSLPPPSLSLSLSPISLPPSFYLSFFLSHNISLVPRP